LAAIALLGRGETMTPAKKSRRTMLERAQEYVEYRRALGYRCGVDGGQLLTFARWADDLGHRGPITVALALQWANAFIPSGETVSGHAVKNSALFRALLRPVRPRHGDSTGPIAGADL